MLVAAGLRVYIYFARYYKQAQVPNAGNDAVHFMLLVAVCDPHSVNA